MDSENTLEQKFVVDNILNFNILINSRASSGKSYLINEITNFHNKLNIVAMTNNKKSRYNIINENVNNKNIEAHTYFSFFVKYLNNECYNEANIESMLKNNYLLKNFKCDILIIDDFHDCNFFLYKLIIVILKNTNKNVSLLILGDEYQTNDYLYDNRFLTNADKIFDFDKPWLKHSLSNNHDISNNIVNFINNCLFKKEIMNQNNKIENQNHEIDYNIINIYNVDEIYELINKVLQKYKHKDIVVFASSVKNNSPVIHLYNMLKSKNIPVNFNNLESINNDKISNEILISTYNNASLIKRNVGIIYGFDDSNKEISKFSYYKCITRIKEKLFLLHNKNNYYLPYINKEDIVNTCKFNNKRTYKKESKNYFTEISVTNLIKMIPYDIMEKLMSYLEIIENDAGEIIEIPNKILINNNYESVSDINGTIIPLYFEYKLKENIASLSIISNKDVKFNYSFDNLFEISIIWSSIKNGYLTNDKIKKCDWLSNEVLEQFYCRLSKYISNDSEFEYYVDNQYNDYNKKITGYIDCIDGHNIWEFKCVKHFTNEHILQLVVYMFLFKQKHIDNYNEYNFYLYNILNDKKIQIKISNDKLNILMKELMDFKFKKEILSDDDFISKINDIKKNVCNIKNFLHN